MIDNCELVDCTGRCIRDDKAGYIKHSNSAILEQLGLNSEQWVTLNTEFEQHFSAHTFNASSTTCAQWCCLKFELANYLVAFNKPNPQ
ncbi:hypothetical protein GARC_5238 [Paraglaciecola arctica BSs20135]|uniref:Uncharacterized protein n=1 Tax=Paraglaciecola arctica BSs20135 TaxID=493475 RepID=K6YZI8_9ALTE|nr:hypothetical protein GARC_5238 [Paraglaciecola arctica BSs20135]